MTVNSRLADGPGVPRAWHSDDLSPMIANDYAQERVDAPDPLIAKGRLSLCPIIHSNSVAPSPRVRLGASTLSAVGTFTKGQARP